MNHYCSKAQAIVRNQSKTDCDLCQNRVQVSSVAEARARVLRRNVPGHGAVEDAFLFDIYGNVRPEARHIARGIEDQLLAPGERFPRGAQELRELERKHHVERTKIGGETRWY